MKITKAVMISINMILKSSGNKVLLVIFSSSLNRSIDYYHMTYLLLNYF